MPVAMVMNIKSPVHHCHLSRTWESNGQVRALMCLVTDAFTAHERSGGIAAQACLSSPRVLLQSNSSCQNLTLQNKRVEYSFPK